VAGTLAAVGSAGKAPVVERPDCDDNWEQSATTADAERRSRGRAGGDG